MITRRQRSLITSAREALALDDETMLTHLNQVAGVGSIDELSAEAGERLLDRFTVMMFRDPRRPILSLATRRALEEQFAHCKLSPFAVEAAMRIHGQVGDLKSLTGRGLLRMLFWLEPYGTDAQAFLEARRTITRAQLRLLQVARKQVQMSEESYSLALVEYGGVNSATDLDGRGFDLVMAVMSGWGFKRELPGRPAPKGLDGRPGFASPEQLAFVRTLWAEWSGSEDDAALCAWLERYHHVSALRFLTAATAAKVITALKAMKRRAGAKQEVSA